MKTWKTVEKYQLWMMENGEWFLAGWYDSKEDALLRVNQSLAAREGRHEHHFVIPVTAITYC